MIATDVVRRLLRQHPKLHPDSAAAGEFRSLGLGNLPFLEADENQPWGCFVDSPGEPLSPLPAFGLSPSKAADHFNSTTDLLLAEATSCIRTRKRADRSTRVLGGWAATWWCASSHP
mmetsp:Transcript_4449/g.16850  ORF Transcript_4449/g.16850 Transcript_4449/m.16850 type:complete len:117 (-) Transcript_4449:1003-1353(-)